jgi:transcription termination factor Rho
MSRPQASQPEAARSQREERKEHQRQQEQQHRREEQPAAPVPAPEGAMKIPTHLSELKSHHINQLVEMAVSNGIENASRMRKQDLIFALLKTQAKRGEAIFGDGTLEVLPDGFGFLRSPETSYLASTDDIYVSPSQIRRFNLHTGDSIEGEIRTPKDGERYFALVKVDKVNAEAPEAAKNKILFENLTPLHPDEQFKLEREIKAEENLTGRVLDIIAPIGKGQRGLIVSPPKAGKTMLMQNIASAIVHNHPDVHLFILLVDERPEEVTDFRRTFLGIPGLVDPDRVQVVASSNDNDTERHIQVTTQTIDRCKQLAVDGKHVVVLLDSLTRMGRAFNRSRRHASSGRTMTGGIDSRALEVPKQVFGAARNTEEAGSLTILATCLVDTGSQGDQVIFEEFKGTGNMELILDRKIAEKRLFPAINLAGSGTRKEHLLMTEQEVKTITALRRRLMAMPPHIQVEQLLAALDRFPTNAALVGSAG